MIKLLFIEDDATLSYIVKSMLEEVTGDYEVLLAANGKEGLEILSKTTPDVIVTDIEMPEMNGLEMVEKIRELNRHIPVLFASGRKTSKDVTAGYDAGANNYIKKPFLPQELDSHIKGLLKFYNNQPAREKEVYELGKYKFYPRHYYLEYQSKKTQLTSTESQILGLLCENTGNVVNRTEILAKFWPVDYDTKYTSRSLDVFIGNLRRCLSEDKSVSIRTVKKVGLILEVEK